MKYALFGILVEEGNHMITGFVNLYNSIAILVSIDKVWIGNQIYWALIQLITTLHKSLSHKD
jgi:hypothetical protein